MEFEKLLSWLYDRFGEGEFDVTDVYLGLSEPKKIVSNDLGRLYRMGFSKRRRVKRLCRSLKGRPCNRGFQYRCSLSRRGLGYLKWLREGKPVQDAGYTYLRSEALSSLPDTDRRKVASVQLMESSGRYRGPGSKPRPAPSDLLANIYLSDQNRALTIDNQELTNGLINEAIEKKGLSTNAEIERLKNAIMDKSLGELRSEYDRYISVSMKKLSDQITIDSSQFEIACRIIHLYKQIAEDLVKTLLAIRPAENVSRLVRYIMDSKKPFTDSIVQELRSLKNPEKPIHMNSTVDQSKTINVVGKRDEATSIIGIPTIETSTPLSERISGRSGAPKGETWRNEQLGPDDKDSHEPAKVPFQQEPLSKNGSDTIEKRDIANSEKRKVSMPQILDEAVEAKEKAVKKFLAEFRKRRVGPSSGEF